MALVVHVHVQNILSSAARVENMPADLHAVYRTRVYTRTYAVLVVVYIDFVIRGGRLYSESTLPSCVKELSRIFSTECKNPSDTLQHCILLGISLLSDRIQNNQTALCLGRTPNST